MPITGIGGLLVDVNPLRLYYYFNDSDEMDMFIEGGT